jgi:putative DNA primase/helicase
MSAAALVDFVAAPQWVAWRNEKRDGKLTKVPYFAPDRQAEADNPATWLPHDQAALISDAIVNGSGGGIGIELGPCGEYWIIGIDLDSCRDIVSGAIAPWAGEVIERLDSYAEVSPSETGVKVFCLAAPNDVPELRRIMGTDHGRQFKRANGESHPPAIELYTSNRYFAVTWDGLPDAPTELRVVPLTDLRWLIEQAGPALSGKSERKRGETDDHAPTILSRLDTAAENIKPIATALRHAATVAGGSRSEGALGLGASLKRAGWDFDDMKAALVACPATKEWAAEADERDFERIWHKWVSPSLT